jgi:DNA-binding ferritin-like protein (Dps family)
MLFNGNLVLTKTNDRFTQWLKVLEVTRIERRAVVELTNGWLSGFINDGGFSARIRKNTRNKMGRQFIQKFSLTQASEFQILKEILQLLESQSSVQIINENNTNAIYYKIKFKVYYRINFY